MKWHSWAEECPAGRPVPEVERCDAVDCTSLPLTALPPGARARVTCLEQPGSAAAARLGALGVLPDVELEVVQRFPAFVIRLGHAEIAVDEALARAIRVRPREAEPVGERAGILRNTRRVR